MNLINLATSAVRHMPNSTKISALLSDLNNVDRLEIPSPAEKVAFFRASLRDAMRFRQLSQNGTRRERWLAGKAGYLTAAYEVARRKPSEESERFIELYRVYAIDILDSVGAGNNQNQRCKMATELKTLLTKDRKGELDQLGFQRAEGHLTLALDVMGNRLQLAGKTSISKVSTLLKTTDDLLRLHKGAGDGTFYLTGNGAQEHLQSLLDGPSPADVSQLFPHSRLLPRQVEQARELAWQMLKEHGTKTNSSVPPAAVSFPE